MIIRVLDPQKGPSVGQLAPLPPVRSEQDHQLHLQWRAPGLFATSTACTTLRRPKVVHQINLQRRPITNREIRNKDAVISGIGDWEAVHRAVCTTP
jgi:hypothetical protein